MAILYVPFAALPASLALLQQLAALAVTRLLGISQAANVHASMQGISNPILQHALYVTIVATTAVDRHLTTAKAAIVLPLDSLILTLILAHAKVDTKIMQLPCV
jgi:hypothetical protein